MTARKLTVNEDVKKLVLSNWVDDSFVYMPNKQRIHSKHQSLPQKENEQLLDKYPSKDFKFFNERRKITFVQLKYWDFFTR